MNDSIETKQNYLYDEIIGQGYDPEAFMNYMAEQKQDGTDIDVWTMSDLMKVVENYKKNYSLQGEDLRNSYSNNPTQPDTNNDENHVYQSEQPESIAPYTPSYVEETYVQKYERELREQQEQEAIAQGLVPPSQLKSEVIRKQQNEIDDNPFVSISIQQPSSQLQQKQIGSYDSGYKSILSPEPLIPFEEDIINYKKKDEFDLFDKTIPSLPEQNPQQQFKNNEIWHFSIPSSNKPTPIDLWGNPTPVQPTNLADPFIEFQFQNSTSNYAPAIKKESSQSDAFSDFFSAPQAQTINNSFNNFQQVQSVAPQTNPQTKNILDSDFDIFSSGVNLKNPQTNLNASNSAPQNKQIKTQKNTNSLIVGTSAVVATTIIPNATEIKTTSPATTENFQIKKQVQQSSTQQKPPPVIQAQTVQASNQSTSNAQANQQPVRKKSLVLQKEDLVDLKYKIEKICKKSVQTVVSVKPDVSITVVDHEIVSGSLFSIGGSNIAIYHVKTMPFNWIVKRKYTDFVWLRSLLIKMYPGIPVPSLPGKSMKSIDEKLVSRRKGYFEAFLHEILTFPELKTSKYITDFLSIQDERVFKTKIKESEKMNKPKNVGEIETSTGKVILNKNPDCNSHSQNLEDYFEQNDGNYEKLKKLSKQLMEGYNSVASTLHQMGEVFSSLFSSVQIYNGKTSVSYQVRELEETYKVMNNMCVMQANSFSDQIKIFQNHFYNFFKFHKDNLSGLKEVVKTRNELSAALSKKVDQNEGGLSGIFRSSKETVYNPSKVLKELEEQVGYYNQQTMVCSKKILENRYKNYSNHFMMYCSLQKSIVAEVVDIFY